nr:accessory gene regulator B family protein [uncultured Tyzzerella sp.]
MESLVNRIISTLISNEIIKKEDKEIYSYGLKQMATTILNLITILVLGIIFNMVLESILFTLMYIPVRIYAGGYHCRTPLRCYLYSILQLILVLLALKIQLLTNPMIITIMSIISSIVILSLAPVEDENKPLDEIEIKVYEKRTIRNLIIVLSILCITLIFNKINLSSCICISLLCNGIMLMLGKINNSVRYKYSK